jgi:hypothetical protein
VTDVEKIQQPLVISGVAMTTEDRWVSAAAPPSAKISKNLSVRRCSMRQLKVPWRVSRRSGRKMREISSLTRGVYLSFSAEQMN